MILGSIITVIILGMAWAMWRSSNDLHNSLSKQTKETQETAAVGIPEVRQDPPVSAVNDQITDSVTAAKPKSRKSATKKPATKKSTAEAAKKPRKKKTTT